MLEGPLAPLALPSACRDHAVAFCPRCQQAFRFADLAFAALAPEPFHRCPRCRTNLSDSLTQHLRGCPRTA